MAMPKISVIVPVYKVEDYLRECVDSILAQTFEDFELILVDDGSPDNCPSICDGYGQKDTRVKVIHQENQGLSGARNSGLDVAAGEYITFIDSDDWIDPKYLEIMLGAMGDDIDITVGQLHEFEDDEVAREEHEKKAHIIHHDAVSAVIKLYDGSRSIPVNAWGKLFRQEIIGNIRFPQGRIHEDQLFTPQVCYGARKIVTGIPVVYYYRIRTTSITRETFSLKRYDDLWAIDSCIEFFRENGEQEIVEAALRRRQRILCSYAVYAYRDGVEVPEKYRIGLMKALRYLRKNVSVNKYQYCLAQINPKLVILDAYVRKISSILRNEK